MPLRLRHPPNRSRKLKRHFSPNKKLGQNFLVDDKIASRIAEAARLTKDTHVLEIGPGLGALTQYLCENAGFVTAIELDKRLPEILRENLTADNYEVIIEDALKTDFAAIRRPQYSSFVLAANLPYNISSPILAKAMQSGLFADIVVMVQREFAQRIAAAPGGRDYGAFTVFARYHADCEKLFDVPPSAFFPIPAVTSSVVRLTPRGSPPCEIADEKLFFRTVRAAFAQRRKTLANALSAAFPEIGKQNITEIIKDCGFGELIRGETLSLQDFARLAAKMQK